MRLDLPPSMVKQILRGTRSMTASRWSRGPTPWLGNNNVQRHLLNVCRHLPHVTSSSGLSDWSQHTLETLQLPSGRPRQSADIRKDFECRALSWPWPLTRTCPLLRNGLWRRRREPCGEQRGKSIQSARSKLNRKSFPAHIQGFHSWLSDVGFKCLSSVCFRTQDLDLMASLIVCVLPSILFVCVPLLSPSSLIPPPSRCSFHLTPSSFLLCGAVGHRPYGLEEDVRQYEQDLAKRLYQARVRASQGTAAPPQPPTTSSSAASQLRSAPWAPATRGRCTALWGCAGVLWRWGICARGRV